MTGPLIGVTTTRTHNAEGSRYVAVTEAYLHAIYKAGGVPVLIPIGLSGEALQLVYSLVQGVLFTGGGDIDPVRFNGVPHEKVYDVYADRDQLEIELVQTTARERTPFLGICRGMQVINVALGGTLYTDISDQLPNALHHPHQDGTPYAYLAHSIQIQKNSRLAAILKADDLMVNSLHHQGVKDVAPGLTTVAQSPDTLVEAVEMPGHPFGVAVQWHPEWLPDSAQMQALFTAFVQAAAENHRRV